MLSPSINNSNIVEVGGISTKIRVPLRIIESSSPNLSRLSDRVGIIILFIPNLKKHSIVFPLINKDELKHNINPLMLRQVVNCLVNFGVVVEEIVSSEPHERTHSLTDIVVW